MSKKYGYLGAIDCNSSATQSRIPTLNAQGEPIYTPYREENWASELRSSDGAWRFLKAGAASKLGGHNYDEVTILTLTKKRTNSKYLQSVYRGGVSPTYRCAVAHDGLTRIGIYSIVLSAEGVQSYPQHICDATTQPDSRQMFDKGWHWVGHSFSKNNTKMWFEGMPCDVSQATHTVASFKSADSTFTINFASNDLSTACVLVYDRTLSDAEVYNIVSGQVRPLDVPNLRGYYKCNETHGNVGGVCTDYSGKGNHLTYNGAAEWEIYTVGGNGNMLPNSLFRGNSVGMSQYPTGWVNTGASAGCGGIFAEEGAGQAINIAKFRRVGAAYEGIQTNLVGMKVGVPHTVSAWVRIPSGIAIADITLYFGSASPNTTPFASVATLTTKPRDTWVRLSKTFTLTANVSDQLAFISALDLGAGAGWDLCQPQLERGSSMSSHTPTYPQFRQVGNTLGGQPYVTKRRLVKLDWRTQKPKQSIDSDMQGSLMMPNTGSYSGVPAHAKFAPQGDFTYTTWFKPLQYASNISFFWGWGSSSYSGVSITYNFGSSPGFFIGWGNGVTSSGPYPAAPFPPAGQWAHLRVSYSKALALIHIYLNNVLVVSQSYTPTVTPASTGGHYVVPNACASRSTRLFHRLLSDDEAEAMFQTDKVGDRTALVGEWLANDIYLPGGIADTSGSALNVTSMTASMVKTLDSPYIAFRKKRKGKQASPSGNMASVYFLCPPSLTAALARYSSITISVWGAVITAAPYSDILKFLDVSAGTLFSFFTGSTIGKVHVGMRSVIADSETLLASQVPDARKYHCYSVTVDFVAKTLYFYVDGVLVGRNLAASSLTAKAMATAYRVKLNGLADDIRVWGRALTAAEHRALFFDIAPKDLLLAEYKFDDDGRVLGPEKLGFAPCNPIKLTLWATLNAASATSDTVANFPNEQAELLWSVSGFNSANKSYQVSIVASGNGTLSFGVSNSKDYAPRNPSLLTSTPALYTTIVTMNATAVTNAGITIIRQAGDTCTQATITSVSIKEISLPQVRDSSGSNNHGTWSTMDVSNYVQVP